MSAREVILIDAGTGNLHSVQNALERAGARVRVVASPEGIVSGGRLVLPGVGAFGRFMTGLRERGLEPAILQAIQRGDPLLGICVGMQALFEAGEELGEWPGLGCLAGRVVRFAEAPGLKIPHTGWNQLWPERVSPLLAGLPAGCYAYFNHSYYCAAGERSDWLAATEYGEKFASMVAKGNLYGVQFHPEKSQEIGRRIIRNYLEFS